MYYLGCFRVFISCVVLFIVKSSDGSEIIGGNEVKPHSLPFMALLEGNIGSCGGILIDQAWVLTAAHCDKIKKVLLGVHSISRDKKNFRQIQKVKKSFPHPCFDAKDKVNDLMLLKLNMKVKKTETVNWLKLVNTVKDPAAGSICLVAGWGKTEKDNSSDVLLSANVTVIDRKKCNSADYYNRKPVITCNMICAGSIGRKTADTCQGDSGGPLLCNGVLTGITSFGPEECGNKTHPGVYAFLSDEQLQWIKKTMTQN